MTGLRCAVCLVVVVLLEHGSAHPAAAAAQKASPSPALTHARDAVSKAAAERKVDLPEPVKRELALEVLRQEAAAPAGVAPAPAAMATELVKSVTAAPAESQPAVDAARVAIASDKVSRVRDTLQQDVIASASTAGLTIPPDVQAMIVKDLEVQTAGLATSGLSVETIRAKNQAYLKSVALQLQGGPVLPNNYEQARQEIFNRFVHLRIESVPSGANVRMNDVELGLTDIAQPLEPNKKYTFDFRLSGYATARREYFLAAGSDDTLREPLTRLDAGEATEEKRTAPPPPERFPWWWVLPGVVVLGALVFMARRL